MRETEFLWTVSFIATLAVIVHNIGTQPLCPYVDDISDSLYESLTKVIGGQKNALSILSNSIVSWDLKRKAGMSEPLVLSISGPTGVGKSETGYRIAKAIFARKTRIGQTARHTPNGMLVLSGEDYSLESEALHDREGNIRNRIKSTVVAHLQKCSANALIIFDEAQKFAPSALDVLLPGLRETGSLSVSGEESVSTTNTIFLFISDIGTNITLNLLLKYGDREAIPHTELRHEMKKALDVQWDSLAFSRTIKEIVPFLHMEMKQIEEVFPIKISEMVDSVMSDHWHKLIISAELIQYLSGPPFVSYDKYKARNSRIIAVASYGARGLTNTGPVADLEQFIQKYMRDKRPDQVANVGIVDLLEDHRALWDINRRGVGYKKPCPVGSRELYFQWCDLTDSMMGPGGSVDFETVVSDTCTTIAFDVM